MRESLKSLERLLNQCTVEEQAVLLDYLEARIPNTHWKKNGALARMLS